MKNCLMNNIKTNKIKCQHCQDIIESTHVHDFKFCSCNTVAVDGGHDYLRRCFTNGPEDYIELSEYDDDNKTSTSRND